MKKMSLILILLIILIISSCKTFEIIPQDTANVNKSIYRGRQILTESQDNIEISIESDQLDKKLVFYIAINNKTGKTVFFDDYNISIFQGNIDTNKWSQIEYYQANEYYRMKEKEYNATAIMLAVSAGLSAINAGYSTSSTSGSYSSYNNNYSGTYSSTTTTYNPSVAYMINTQNAQTLSNYILDSEYNLQSLKNSLLYSSEIKPDEIYGGLVFSETEKGPDYKFIITINNMNYEFKYRRSDREEIINPFADKNRPQSVIFYNYNMDLPFGIGYSKLAPKGLGWFCNMNFLFPSFGVYENGYEDFDSNGEVIDPIGLYTPRSERTYFMFEPVVGLNYKIVNNAWIKFGIGSNFITEYRLYDHYWDIYPDPADDYWDTRWASVEKVYMEINPRIGIDYVLSDLYIGGSCIYKNLEAVSFEVSVGFAF